jgi:tetratricopeptide (TPR) repeat protein
MESKRVAEANAEYSQTRMAMQESMSVREPAVQKDKLGAVITSAESLATAHSGEYIGRRAHLFAGNAYYRQAALEEGAAMADLLAKAVDSYQKALAVATTNEESASAQLGIGNAKEDLMFMNPSDTVIRSEAIKAYEEAAALGKGTYLEGAAKLALARVSQATEGGAARAEALYKEVMDQRKLDPADGSGQVKTASGDLLTSEQLADIRNRSDISFEGVARRNLQRLPALPKQTAQ